MFIVSFEKLFQIGGGGGITFTLKENELDFSIIKMVRMDEKPLVKST